MGEAWRTVRSLVLVWLLFHICACSSTQAASSDSIITFNEVMYHPATNEAALEWVEIYNQMSYDIDLSGWRLDGGVDFTFAAGTRIRGRGYLVVASNPTALEAATGLAGIVGPFSNRLSNTGEILELKNNNNRLMDQLSYEAEFDWPVAADGAGPSLAKINPTAPSGPVAAWTASGQSGGSPGARNFVPSGTFTVPSGLVSYWNCNDTNAGLADLAGGNHGVTGTGVTRVNGLVGRHALAFDSTSNAFVNVGAGVANSFSVTDGLTVEMLVRPDWDGNSDAIFFQKEEVSAGTLVSYWSFDEAATGTVSPLDPISGNHGTFIDSATRVPGLAGLGAARFNNTGADGVAVGAGANNSFSCTTGLTVFARIRPLWTGASGDYDEIFRKEDGGNRILLSFQNDANNGGANPPVAAGPVLSFGLNVGGVYGELDMPLDGAAGRPTLTQLKDGSVHSIAATYESGTGRKAIYVDGTLRWSVLLTGPINSGGSASAVIGNAAPGGGEAFNGTIDEVALWRAALTAEQIAALASGSLPSTLGSGAIPAASRRILFGFQKTAKPGIANPPVPPGPVLSFGLNVGGTYSEFALPLDGAAGRPTVAQLQDGRPHHVAATYDRVTGLKSIYVDGTPRGSATLTGAISSGGSASAILGNAAFRGTDPFGGTLDEVAFWNRALTPTEISRHAAVVQTGQDYFGSGAALEGKPALAFNELASSTNADFWVELMNYGAERIELGGYALARHGGTNRLYRFPAIGLAANSFLQVSRQTLGFGVDSSDRLILYAPDGVTVIDAVVAKKEPRARHPDGTGAWLFPAALTPASSNAFVFREEIVINEIMYHHRPVPGTPAVFGPTNTLLGFDNAWRYQDQDVDPGTAWRAAEFDDGEWPVGPALLYNTPSTFPVPKNTLLLPTNAAGQRVITYYFRTPFQLTSDPAAARLSLRTIVDDGAVYYLNGVEVLRQNMPAGSIGHSTVAGANVGVAGITGPFSVSAASLKPGVNLLAVEVHRISTVDNDVVFGAELSVHQELAPGLPFRDSPESWVELFNRGSSSVDLTGWRLDEGIDFRFAAGTQLAPGAYLVVAKDVSHMRSLYPALDVVGPFTNRLSKSGDWIVLKDARNNPADEVRYADGGFWPEAADGGGSSLELKDPWSDNSNAASWAASDEGANSEWSWYTNRAVAVASPQPSTTYNELVLGLLDGGECLIDDLRVVESPTNNPVSLLQNGAFAGGLNAWRIVGNHSGSVVVDPLAPGNSVLRLLATGPTEYLHNHAETTLKNGASYYSIVNGRHYEVSFRAKWISGNNLLNSRLWMNRIPRTFELAVPPRNGTPGARNSRWQSNAGPTFTGLRHTPAVPPAGQSVTVTVQARDPQGVASATLFWSVNGGTWLSAPMVMDASPAASNSVALAATIPGAVAGAVVHFYAQAADALGATATFPPAGPAARALYRVNDGAAMLTLAHNLRLIMTPADTSLLFQPTNLMSNGRLGATVLWDEEQVYYDVGIRLKGSEHGRADANRLGFFVDFRSDQLFRGVHSSLGIDRSGGWRFGTTFGQDEIVIKHIVNHAGGLPGMYDDLIRVLAPRTQYTGPAIMQMARYGDVFLDSQYQNGADGTAFEYELLYDEGVTTGGPEGFKLPQEGPSVIGVPLAEQGNQEENYRLNFIIKNNRDRDDFSGLMTALKALGQPAGAGFDSATAVALDVDEWLRAYAACSLVGAADNYGGDNAQHNLQLYTRPEDQKTLFLIWDTDFAFIRSATDSIAANSDLNKFIANPAQRRRYYGHLMDIISTTYNTAYMGYWTDHYDNFLPGQNFSSILSYIGQRATYVMNQLPTNASFAITSNAGNNFGTASNVVALSGTAPLRVDTIEVNGVRYPITWTSISNWTVQVSLLGGINTLVVQGLDRFGHPASNVTDTITVTNSGAGSLLPVTINEWMAGNSGPGGFADPVDGAFQDWFELFNPNPIPVNLSAYHLTDNLAQPGKFTLPPGTVIPARGFLLVWADEEGSQNGTGTPPDLHASFKLDAGGETLALFAPNGITLQHSVAFGPQTQNVSEGLFPDGHTNGFHSMPDWTPGVPNRLGPPAAPTILEAELQSGDELVLTLSALPGRTYRVEFKNDLVDPVWNPLGDPITAAGTRARFTDALAGVSQRFYRVALLE